MKAKEKLIAEKHRLMRNVSWNELDATERNNAIRSVIYSMQVDGLVGDEDGREIERSCIELVFGLESRIRYL